MRSYRKAAKSIPKPFYTYLTNFEAVNWEFNSLLPCTIVKRFVNKIFQISSDRIHVI